MQTIDWPRVLSARGVEYVERGPNVKRGHINVKCPFCGQADPSHHLGINLENGYWGCWRNSEHRGKSPVRLLVALLRLPVYEVRALLGYSSGPDLSAFASVRERLMKGGAQHDDTSTRPDRIELPVHARIITRHLMQCAPFYDYLQHERSFGDSTGHIVLRYSLHACWRGTFKQRVLFPYMYRSRLVTWTGRAITDATLRYRDLEQSESVLHKDEVLFNYDHAAQGGRILIVVEGPMDTVKLDYGGRWSQAHAVGLSTNNMTIAQMDLLAELASAYDKVYIGLDQPTEFARLDSVRMVSQLSAVVKAEPLPYFPYKDFGEAPMPVIEEFVRSLRA